MTGRFARSKSYLTHNGMLFHRLLKLIMILTNSEVIYNSSDGRVVSTFATGAVDSGLIPSRVKPMTLKLVFTTSLFDAQH